MNVHASGLGLFNHAGLYDRLNRLFGFRPLYTRAVADVAQASLPDGARVLDVGTGTGRVPIGIAKSQTALHVEGLDLSAQMIAFARRSAGSVNHVRFTVGDVADLPYPDDTFDLILSTMSQHHWADVQGGMRELNRVLNPAGQLWIYDFKFALQGAERAARSTFTSHTFDRSPISTLTARLTVRPV
jgi:ubiquinone/menaquinone biosynthesis C-methylase UbiE